MSTIHPLPVRKLPVEVYLFKPRNWIGRLCKVITGDKYFHSEIRIGQQVYVRRWGGCEVIQHAPGYVADVDEVIVLDDLFTLCTFLETKYEADRMMLRPYDIVALLGFLIVGKALDGRAATYCHEFVWRALHAGKVLDRPCPRLVKAGRLVRAIRSAITEYRAQPVSCKGAR
jgi:hypothetical protein